MGYGAAAATVRSHVPIAPALSGALPRLYHQQLHQRRRDSGFDGSLCLSTSGRRAEGLQEGPADGLQETSGSGSGVKYTEQDCARWRAEFGFARQQHSLACLGYTDDELLEWRKPFDELALNNRISFAVFERYVKRKFSNVINDDELAEKIRCFWKMFDNDCSDYIDFGEFIKAGTVFDVDLTREKIRKRGVQATFMQYAEDELMVEPHFFQLMSDFNFFVVTTTDVQGFMKSVDQDKDGLISLDDFLEWAESDELPTFKERFYSKKRSVVPLPPAEPDDDDDEW